MISGGVPKDGTAPKIAGSATWKDERTLELTARFYETPHSDTLTCVFDGDRVTIRFMSSTAALNQKKDARPDLQGRLIA